MYHLYKRFDIVAPVQLIRKVALADAFTHSRTAEIKFMNIKEKNKIIQNKINIY